MKAYPRATGSARSIASLCVILLAAFGLAVLLSPQPAIGQHATTDTGTPVEPAEPSADNPTLSPGQETLAQTIFNELISPCCWTTTVAVHGSGAAPRIQAEVRRMIAGGMTHQQILDRYVKEYGERILAKPKKSGFNLTAYWVPYLALLIGVVAIVVTFRRRKMAMAAAGASRGAGPAIPMAKRTPVSGPDDEYHRRIEEELRRSS